MTDDTPTASELVRALLAAPRPSEVVLFPDPRIQKSIRILVLVLEDHDQARLMAQENLKARRVKPEDWSGEGAKAVFGDGTAVELLWRACVEVEPVESPDGDKFYPKVFQSPKQMRDLLSADQLTALFNAYLVVQHRLGPFERGFAPEELDAWISRLSEGLSFHPLEQMTLPQLVDLTQCLARRASDLFARLASLSASSPTTSDAGTSASSPSDSDYSGSRRDDSGTSAG